MVERISELERKIREYEVKEKGEGERERKERKKTGK